jgi:hypothetical protein
LDTHILFIDCEKAVNIIKEDILKYRNIPDTLLKTTANTYTKHKILIKFNAKLTKLVDINKGVR